MIDDEKNKREFYRLLDIREYLLQYYFNGYRLKDVIDDLNSALNEYKYVIERGQKQ